MGMQGRRISLAMLSVLRDFTDAYGLYRKAASKGWPISQYELGLIADERWLRFNVSSVKSTENDEAVKWLILSGRQRFSKRVGLATFMKTAKA